MPTNRTYFYGNRTVSFLDDPQTQNIRQAIRRVTEDEEHRQRAISYPDYQTRINQYRQELVSLIENINPSITETTEANQMPISMSNTAQHIKSAFRFDNRNRPNSSHISPLGHPEFYPDYNGTEGFNGNVSHVADLEMLLTSYHAEMSRLAEPVDIGYVKKYINIDNIVAARHYTADSSNQYAHYVASAVHRFIGTNHIIYALAGAVTSDLKYSHYTAINGNIMIDIYNYIVSHKFTIVGMADREHPETEQGKAAITDEKGRMIYMRPGRAIKKMFPNLPTSFVTHMVEAIKDHYDKVNVRLYVHEGGTRKDFLYGYMMPQAQEVNPSLGYPFASLSNSCMRSQVLCSELGITEPNFRHLNSTARRSGIHPVEAYASGDFTMVYVSDKPDPYDVNGKVHARAIVGHIDVDREELAKEIETFKQLDDYVMVSKVYVTSEISKGFILGYLKDKYEYVPSREHSFNFSPILTMINRYIKDESLSYSRESSVRNSIRRTINKVVRRRPRMLAIHKNGKNMTTDNLNYLYKGEESSSDYYRNIVVISPYLDYSGNYYRGKIIMLDEDGNVPEASDTRRPLYLYMMNETVGDKVFSHDDSSPIGGWFGKYDGVNTLNRMSKIVTCHLTKKKFTSSKAEVVDIYRNGELDASQVYVNIHEFKNSRESIFVKVGNKQVVWFYTSDKDYDDTSCGKTLIVDIYGTTFLHTDPEFLVNRNDYIPEGLLKFLDVVEYRKGKYAYSNTMAFNQLQILVECYQRMVEENTDQDEVQPQPVAMAV